MMNQQPLTGRTSVRFDTSPEFKASLQRAAREEGRTTSNFVRHEMPKALSQRSREEVAPSG